MDWAGSAAFVGLAALAFVGARRHRTLAGVGVMTLGVSGLGLLLLLGLAAEAAVVRWRQR